MIRAVTSFSLLLGVSCVDTPPLEPLPPEPFEPAEPPAPAEPPSTTDDAPDRSIEATSLADCWIFEAVNPDRHCHRHLGRYPRILFDDDEALADDAETKATVEQLVRVLAEIDGVVEIGVGTRSKGSAEFNLHRSQVRAEALVTALEAHSVPGDRMVAVGYGETRPVITNAECNLSERVDVWRLDGPCAR